MYKTTKKEAIKKLVQKADECRENAERMGTVLGLSSVWRR